MSLFLKPVPSLHKKLVFDKPLSSVSKTCFVSQAKLPAFPVDVVREGGALVVVEAHETVPFVVSEVPPSRHNVPPTVEQINDSTLLLFEGAEESMTERARQIDRDEAKAESAMIVERTLHRLEQKHQAERARFAAIVLTDTYPRPRAHVALVPAIRAASKSGTVNVRQPRGRTVEIDGVSRTRAQWAKFIGISYRAMTQRIARGQTLEQAVATGNSAKPGPKPKPRNDNQPCDSRGVVSNFAAFEGTGGGRLLQESPEITFSEKAKSS